MKEREITVNLKHFSREIFSPLFLQKEFFPTLQNKMKCRRKEIAARRCKCIVDGIVRKALSTGSFCTPGTQIKTPITAVNHKQLTSSASHYKETTEFNSALLRGDAHSWVPGQEPRERHLPCPAPTVQNQAICLDHPHTMLDYQSTKKTEKLLDGKQQALSLGRRGLLSAWLIRKEWDHLIETSNTKHKKKYFCDYWNCWSCASCNTCVGSRVLSDA